MTRFPRASLIERWEARGRPFAQLSRAGAVTVLALLAAAMAWSIAATAPAMRAARVAVPALTANVAPATAARPDPDDGDLALYARIHARMVAGEGYYAAALAEHRRDQYPTRPFVAVRLPTLAWLQLAFGVGGVRYVMMGLAAACLLALLSRLAPLVSLPERLAALVLMALGGAAVVVARAGLIHELWAGLCLTLALLLHREGRWGGALAAAAAALAVRELALPFVALWLAFALVERRWREAGALAVLIAVFALGMALHADAVAAARLPGDPVSQGWSALSGYALPIMAVWRLTGLAELPLALGAPLALLPLLGWVSLGGRLGLFAALWFAGLATMVALFARPENFYWVQLGLPAYGLGLAFAPRALGELVARAARQT